MEGGFVPKDDWDRVPALIEKGCVIISPQTARAHSHAFLEKLNAVSVQLSEPTDDQYDLLQTRNLQPSCNFFWGSHGCDLPKGHDGKVHTCDFTDVVYGPCSQYDEDAPADRRVRFAYDDGEWGEWREYGEGWWME